MSSNVQIGDVISGTKVDFGSERVIYNDIPPKHTKFIINIKYEVYENVQKPRRT